MFGYEETNTEQILVMALKLNFLLLECKIEINIF